MEKDGDGTVNRLTTTDDEGDAESLASWQDVDVELAMIKWYLLANELPDEEGKARELILNKSQYEVIDNVLYHIDPDRIVPLLLTGKGCLKQHMEEF